VPIIVPCHRVIGADGSLTGYGGGLQRKQALLDLESRPSGGAGRVGPVVWAGRQLSLLA
jgi:alkylated DNA nucleotide flippase Atl1